MSTYKVHIKPLHYTLPRGQDYVCIIMSKHTFSWTSITIKRVINAGWIVDNPKNDWIFVEKREFKWLCLG